MREVGPRLGGLRLNVAELVPRPLGSGGGALTARRAMGVAGWGVGGKGGVHRSPEATEREGPGPPGQHGET